MDEDGVYCMAMTKLELISKINEEDGENYALNVNLNGYTFFKNGSFIIFEFKSLEDVQICHIKYIYFKNKKDLMTILVNCCNFWMGNKVQFIFYKEKSNRENSAVKFLKDLKFRVDIISNPKWKYRFKCKTCQKPCECSVYSLYK